jgi:hypothetical protein
MGRRSRKRGGAPTSAAEREAPSAAPAPQAAAPARPVGVRPDRRARMAEAPKAPWSPFPLVELCILVGIVLIVVGLVGGSSKRGLLLACGFALVSLSGLELSLREHFAGFRSHSSLLAGAAAVVVDIPLYFLTKLPQEALLGVAVAVFLVAFQLLRSAFRHRAGGLGFRA